MLQRIFDGFFTNGGPVVSGEVTEHLRSCHRVSLMDFFYKENTVLTTADENLKNVGFAFTELSIADYDGIRSSSDCRFK